jgi:hypothetical protein
MYLQFTVGQLIEDLLKFPSHMVIDKEISVGIDRGLLSLEYEPIPDSVLKGFVNSPLKITTWKDLAAEYQKIKLAKTAGTTFKPRIFNDSET